MKVGSSKSRLYIYVYSYLYVYMYIITYTYVYVHLWTKITTGSHCLDKSPFWLASHSVVKSKEGGEERVMLCEVLDVSFVFLHADHTQKEV